jgi:hypothetical protein
VRQEGIVASTVRGGLVALAAALTLGSIGCEFEETAGRDSSGRGKTVTNADWAAVFDRSATGYGSADVRLVGRVYEREGDLFLMWGDWERGEKPAAVRGVVGADVTQNGLVFVRGEIIGRDSYETASGERREAVVVEAALVRNVSEERARALSRGS